MENFFIIPVCLSLSNESTTPCSLLHNPETERSRRERELLVLVLAKSLSSQSTSLLQWHSALEGQRLPQLQRVGSALAGVEPQRRRRRRRRRRRHCSAAVAEVVDCLVVVLLVSHVIIPQCRCPCPCQIIYDNSGCCCVKVLISRLVCNLYCVVELMMCGEWIPSQQL